jgi:hypothetical protein
VVARAVRACSCFALRYGDAHAAAAVARTLLLESSTS